MLTVFLAISDTSESGILARAFSTLANAIIYADALAMGTGYSAADAAADGYAKTADEIAQAGWMYHRALSYDGAEVWVIEQEIDRV